MINLAASQGCRNYQTYTNKHNIPHKHTKKQSPYNYTGKVLDKIQHHYMMKTLRETKTTRDML